MPQLFEKPRILQVKYWLADKCNISGHKLPPPLQFSRKYFTSSLLHHVHLRWCQSPPSWRPMASGNLVAGTCLHWGSMPVTRYFKILQYSTINTPGDLHIWSFWKDIKVSNSVKVWQGLYPLAPHPTALNTTLHNRGKVAKLVLGSGWWSPCDTQNGIPFIQTCALISWLLKH